MKHGKAMKGGKAALDLLVMLSLISGVLMAMLRCTK
jgi:hypothetical protein